MVAEYIIMQTMDIREVKLARYRRLHEGINRE